MRQKRKKEHVENYLKSTFRGDTLFRDIYLEHNALPDLNLEDIDTKTEFLGKIIDYPIIINAMTGGSELSQDINKDLAKLAKEFNIPMAVGSQTIAVEDDTKVDSFKIVRDTVGADRLVISNLSGQASLDYVRSALEIVNGDAIQLHLNPAQELAMVEGDRDFKGILNNIEEIVKNIDKPVIIKEVGFGISKDVANKLYNVGVRNIDISGSGGTNFIEIENLRNIGMDLTDLYDWGIPTALALIKCRELPADLNIIASGGIRNSMDIVKAIVLGANVVGISGELLSYLIHGGYENAKKYLEEIIYKLKIIMLLLGKQNLVELQSTKYKIVGDLKELI